MRGVGLSPLACFVGARSADPGGCARRTSNCWRVGGCLLGPDTANWRNGNIYNRIPTSQQASPGGNGAALRRAQAFPARQRPLTARLLPASPHGRTAHGAPGANMVHQLVQLLRSSSGREKALGGDSNKAPGGAELLLGLPEAVWVDLLLSLSARELAALRRTCRPVRAHRVRGRQPGQAVRGVVGGAGGGQQGL